VQSASVRVIRNRETLFRTATARACVRQVVCVWTFVGMRVGVGVCTLYTSAPFGRTLCPVPQVRVSLALDSLLPAHPPSPPHYRSTGIYRGYWL